MKMCPPWKNSSDGIGHHIGVIARVIGLAFGDAIGVQYCPASIMASWRGLQDHNPITMRSGAVSTGAMRSGSGLGA